MQDPTPFDEERQREVMALIADILVKHRDLLLLASQSLKDALADVDYLRGGVASQQANSAIQKALRH